MLDGFAGDGVQDPADAAEVVFDEAVGDAVLEEGVGGVAGAVEEGGEDVAVACTGSP